MSEPDRIYRVTSIGRPLDPALPTNRAILILMPLGALLYAAIGLSESAAPLAVAGDALTGLLVVFGSWALTRELAPDDDPAAFVAVLLAFTVLVAFGDVSLLLLFTTLFLIRTVNRSTGLAPRISDSLIVLALALGTAWSLSMPLLAAVTAAAFVLDAMLAGGRRIQLVGAAIAALAFVLLLAGPDGMSLTLTIGRTSAVLLAIALAYTAVVATTSTIRSTGDVSGAPLDAARVRAGMVIGIFVPIVAFVSAPGGAGVRPLLWACIAAVGLSGIAGRLLHYDAGAG